MVKAADKMGDLIPLRIACERIGRDDSTLRHAIRRGSLKGLKINGAWYVHKDSIESYLENMPTRVGAIRRKWRRRLKGKRPPPRQPDGVNDRNYRIFMKYVSGEMSYEELAKAHELTRQRIQQIVEAVDKAVEEDIHSR